MIPVSSSLFLAAFSLDGIFSLYVRLCSTSGCQRCVLCCDVIRYGACQRHKARRLARRASQLWPVPPIEPRPTGSQPGRTRRVRPTTTVSIWAWRPSSPRYRERARMYPCHTSHSRFGNSHSNSDSHSHPTARSLALFSVSVSVFKHLNQTPTPTPEYQSPN